MAAGNVGFAKYPMEKSTNVNAKSTDVTPLFEALISSESSLEQRVECVKLIIEGGASPDDEIVRYLEICNTEPEFSLLEPVLANLVLREAKGERISEKIFESIDCHPKLKDYVVSCREELDGMRKEKFHVSTDRFATLFDFLTESDDKFVDARRDQLHKIVKKYKFNSNYSGILQKRYKEFSKNHPESYMYNVIIIMISFLAIPVLIPYLVSALSKIKFCKSQEGIFGCPMKNIVLIVILAVSLSLTWGIFKVYHYFEHRRASSFSGRKSIINPTS